MKDILRNMVNNPTLDATKGTRLEIRMAAAIATIIVMGWSHEHESPMPASPDAEWPMLMSISILSKTVTAKRRNSRAIQEVIEWPDTYWGKSTSNVEECSESSE